MRRAGYPDRLADGVGVAASAADHQVGPHDLVCLSLGNQAVGHARFEHVGKLVVGQHPRSADETAEVGEGPLPVARSRFEPAARHGCGDATRQGAAARCRRDRRAGGQGDQPPQVAKHFITTITDDSFSFERDLEKIAAEEELDGLYIVRSNVEPELFGAQQTVRAYKDLAKVERTFRSMKTVDLKLRPIYHRRPERVRAHVLLCMLAYYVEWHMRANLAPVCSTTMIGTPHSDNDHRWCRRRSARRRHRRRRPASAPPMICRCTVFAA